jgi:hypothetical protein
VSGAKAYKVTYNKQPGRGRGPWPCAVLCVCLTAGTLLARIIGLAFPEKLQMGRPTVNASARHQVGDFPCSVFRAPRVVM